MTRIVEAYPAQGPADRDIDSTGDELQVSKVRLSDYVRMARADHWFKNVFLLPGTAMAVFLSDTGLLPALLPTLKALASACLIASANYTINEWLDADFDRHHPLKRERPAVSGRVRAGIVYLQYGLLAAAGLAIAAFINQTFLIVAGLFLIMGLVYNVNPVRTKERVYLDIVSESMNNPIRLTMGWSAVTANVLPPSSLLLAFWMGGAFLMTVKRFSEYRFIDDPDRAENYRRSFRFYTEEKLLLTAFFFAITASFFLGVFLIKYRIEYLLTFPLFALLFAWYLAVGLRPRSIAQTPEKLYSEGRFVTFVIFLCLVVILLLYIDLPGMYFLVDPIEF